MRRFLVYGSGEAVYFLAVQLIAMGLLSRRLSVTEFGAFSLSYSLALFVSSLIGRTLQHTTIRLHPGGSSPGATYDALYRGLWVGGAVLAAGVTLLAFLLAASRIGIPPMHATVGAATATAVYAFGQVTFDGSTTRFRVLRRFGAAAGSFTLFALVLVPGLVAFPTPDPRSALWAFAVAALVAGTPLVTRAARPAGGVTESERTGATDTLVWSTALWFGGYTTVTLASRYADRFVVGAVLGADSAGVYFALNNSAVAPLLPVVFLARFVHGFVASYRDPSELAPPLKRRLRLLAVITVTAAPLAGMIGGPFVLGIVYPAVDLEPVLVPWLVFAFGRGVFQVRATWESLLSRWGRVGPLLPWESTFLVVEVVGVALASRSFGLAGALYVSGLVYLLSGLTALGLARSLWRGSTEDATEPREAVPGPPG